MKCVIILSWAHSVDYLNGKMYPQAFDYLIFQKQCTFDESVLRLSRKSTYGNMGSHFWCSDFVLSKLMAIDNVSI